MTCPHCKTGTIDERTQHCQSCGKGAAESDTLDLPIADDIEQSIKKLLGKDFQIEGMIGRGGMSLVYLARELDLNRTIALKVLPLQLSFGPGAAERFKREAKISAALDHPHIIPIYRVGSTSSLLWYSMKFVKGQSLAGLLRERGPLALDVVLDIVGQVASGLEYAHRRGVIHRDIKPENVMIDDHGWVWVCDFGVAKAFGSIPLTQTGGTLGTPGYMSPEQCLGHTLDGSSDQYSLAILTYECLAGKRPFDADSLGAMIQKHTMEPPPRLSDQRSGLPQAVSDALLKAMSKKPPDRFESVSAFVQAIGGKVLLRGSEIGLEKLVHVETETPQPGASPPKRRQRVAPYAIAAGGTLAVVAAILWNPDGSGALQRDQAEAPRPVPAEPVSAPTTAGNQATRTSEPAAPIAGSRRPEPADSAPESRDPVDFFVYSTPLGNLHVDGRLVGTTNMPLKITPGRRTIRIEADGYRAFVRDITVTPGRRVVLRDIVLQPVP